MLRGEEEARCGRAMLIMVGKGTQHPTGSRERSQKGGRRKEAAAVAAQGVGQEEGQEEEDGAVGATAASPAAPAGPKIHSHHASSVAPSLYLSPPCAGES